MGMAILLGEATIIYTDLPLLRILSRFALELFLGKDSDLDQRGGGGSTTGNQLLGRTKQVGLFQKTKTKWRLLLLYWQMRGYLDLLLAVHGHQIFIDGVFNGDPHPGNVLEMPNGKLGLIDYGQCQRLQQEERLAMAKIVALLGRQDIDRAKVAHAMREFGFQTKLDRDDMLSKYATLFFDSDIEGKRMGFATPQLYFMHLNSVDPLVHVPDPAGKFHQ